MITVTFFTDESAGFDEKEYTGDSAFLCAELDMNAHLSRGGYCMAQFGNKAVLVTSPRQLSINQ